MAAYRSPAPTRRRPCAPDDERGSDRHQFPEDEDGQQIAGEDDAYRAAGVAEGGRKLDDAALVEREQAAGEGHDGENGREQTRQRVAFDEHEFVAEERCLAAPPRPAPAKSRYKRDQRQAEKHKPA